MTDKTPEELGARSAMTDFLEDVAEELRRARRKHAPMHSLHEAYAVILEEMDEFWDEVRAWHGGSGQDADAKKARKELVQIAAMAARAAGDLIAKELSTDD